jgi:hypothetical protein
VIADTEDAIFIDGANAVWQRLKQDLRQCLVRTCDTPRF